MPGDGPVPLRRRPTARRARRRSIGEISGDGYTHDGHRPEGALGARPDARHRVRGPPRSPRSTIAERRRPTVVRHRRCSEAGPGDAAVDLARAAASSMLALGDAGTTVRLRLIAAPLRRVLFDTGAIAGFGWSTLPGRRRRRRRPAPSSRPTTALANEHLRVDVDARDGHVRDRDDRRPARRRARPARRRRRRRRHVQLLPARRRPRRRHARRGARHDARDRPGARPACSIDADYTWPAHAIGDVRSCSRAQRRDRARHRAHDARAARRRAVPARHARARQPGPRPPAPRALPAARRRSTGSDAECAFAVVHRGLTAEGGAHEYGLPTFPSRRFVDASDGAAGLALAARRPARVRGRRRRPRARAHAAARRSATSRAPSRRCGPNPAGPPDPVDGAQLLGAQRAEYAVLLHRGDWRAADCYGAADAFLVPFERARGGGARRRDRPASGRALRVDGAEVSAVLRVAGRLVVRVFRTARRRRARSRSSTKARPPAAGSSTSAADRVAPFEGDGRPPPLGDLHPPPRRNRTARNRCVRSRQFAWRQRRSWKTSTRLVEAGER